MQSSFFGLFHKKPTILSGEILCYTLLTYLFTCFLVLTNNLSFIMSIDRNGGGIFMRKFKVVTFFLIGGVGYAVIELLWRGRTHPTMIVAGGLCFLLFSIIAEKLSHLPRLICAFLGALGVTAIELVFGIVFNIIFKMHVWDYSSSPLNFLGQICPLYSLLWVGLSLFAIPLAERINRLFANIC